MIARQLRQQGYAGLLTILKDHLRQVRPGFLAAASYQRTSYLPGKLAQVDWWHSGLGVPVGKGRTRQAFGLVATLPCSAALLVVFTLACGTAEFCAALVGCLQRLGGLPGAIVSDSDAAIVAGRRGGTVRLVAEVAALYGGWGCGRWCCDPVSRKARGRSDARSATWSRRLRRSVGSATWPTCKPRPTPGRFRRPTSGTCVGWARGWLTRWWSSGPHYAGSRSAGRYRPAPGGARQP